MPCELQLELLKPRHTRWLHFGGVECAASIIIICTHAIYICIYTICVCICPHTTSYNRHCNRFHLFRLFNFDFCLLFCNHSECVSIASKLAGNTNKNSNRQTSQTEKKANKLSTLRLGQVGFLYFLIAAHNAIKLAYFTCNLCANTCVIFFFVFRVACPSLLFSGQQWQM